MNELEFKDLLSTAVITTRGIINKSTQIRYVSHDAEDGAWQFLELDAVLDPSKAVLVSLKEIIGIDPSITELADLPLGWHAERPEGQASWIKK